MKKVLIIGGCGYLGARIAEFLANRNYEVSILDTFTPEGYDDYHGHEFKDEDGKLAFDILDGEKDTKRLIKSYYQLMTYNSQKAQDDIINSQINMEDTNKCLNNKVHQLKNSNVGGTFDNAITQQLNDNKFDDELYASRQQKQNDQLERIEDKIEQVKDYKGVKVTDNDLKIKTLKSVKDGTLFRLEEMAGEKKLVLMNSGCMAFSNHPSNNNLDEYGVMPCNIFNKEQHFKIKKIDNLDEYNFLLGINMNDTLTEEENKNINYPFYVLQPDKSNKCVVSDNKSMTIQSCNKTKSSRYVGYFNDNNCNV